MLLLFGVGIFLVMVYINLIFEGSKVLVMQIMIQLSELETTKRFLNAELDQLHKVYRSIGSH